MRAAPDVLGARLQGQMGARQGTAGACVSDPCAFSGISLISGKSEVPFLGNSHSFREKDM